uniref:Uncharacterized protein n=1 Tax=Sinocyclocheilus anshuiensis TaxID=1608454 RepID=A0A671RDG1_9TELE
MGNRGMEELNPSLINCRTRSAASVSAVLELPQIAVLENFVGRSQRLS